MKNWFASLKTYLQIYQDRRQFTVLLLGIASGLPLPLTTSTLSFWLAQEGINKATIGAFALVGLPYTLKFLWAPLIDRLPLPWFSKRFGRRRGWLLAIQIALMAATMSMGFMDPKHASIMALCALLVAFLSASQDIVIDAFRIEILNPKSQGAGAAVIVLGYRIGMLLGGAGALYLSEVIGFRYIYMIMGVFVMIGMWGVFSHPEPAGAPSPTSSFGDWMRKAVVEPFSDFMSRPNWVAILLFVMLYKLGDAFAANMSSPFYVEMGFSGFEVANISKVFGLIATLTGVVIGGIIVGRLGILKALLVCGILQMLSNLMFAAQAVAGHDVGMLTLTISIENIAGGMGTAAFVGYISSLCSASFTATQFASLSAFTAVARTLLSSSAGVAAEYFGWVHFFIFSTTLALPGLFILLYLMRFPVAFGVGKGDESLS